MTERKYLPTISELIDRLSIVLMKSVFIVEHRAAYRKEMELIKHDIDLELCAVDRLTSNEIYAILVLMLANRYVWENEASIRQGGEYTLEQLRATHSINGVRNRAKNIIAEHMGERVDLKTDCLAADLPPEFGQWNVL